MATWKLDAAHSEVKFKVKHLVISTVTGQFNSFSGIIESSRGDFSDANISFEANIDSIDTNDKGRDGHLMSADFFDAAKYPKLFFKSKTVKKKSDNELEVAGDITIRGITKDIKLKVIFNGIVNGFGGAEVAGFEISGRLNRLDFGLHWNGITEAGGIVVSDDVKLNVQVQMVKQA